MMNENELHLRQYETSLNLLEDIIKQAKPTFMRKDLVGVPKDQALQHLTFLQTNYPQIVSLATDIVAHREEMLTAAETQAAAIKSAAKNEANSIVADAQKELSNLQRQVEETKQEAISLQQANDLMVEQAKQRAQSESKAILDKAQAEAKSLVQQGEDRALELLKDEAIYQRAQVAANELEATTKAKMEALRQKTFAYLDTMLGQMEEYTGNLMDDIHDQRTSLSDSQQR